jgi:O-antigen/teichoic acid export membrane protein
MSEAALAEPLPVAGRRGGFALAGAWLLSTATVGSGVLAYAFHVVAARSLGPHAYGLVAVLWAAMFIAVVVLFRPLEQTTARALADRRVRGEEVRSVVRSVVLIYLAVTAVVLAGGIAFWPVLRDRLFDGDGFFVAALLLGISFYGVQYVLRGVWGGIRWFKGYGIALLGDGVTRLLVLAPVVFVASGNLAAAAVAAAALGGVFAPLAFGRGMLRPVLARGEGARFRVGSAMSFAAPAAVIAASDQILVNAAPLLVVLSGTDDATRVAGVVFAATMIVRVPVFVFTGFAASLLPNLTQLQATADRRAVEVAVLRALGLFAAAAAALAALAATIGPDTMRFVYGAGFETGRAELALLAVGVGGYLGMATLSQALLAIDDGKAAATAWAGSCALFLALYVVLPGEPLLRIATALAIATALGTTALYVALRRRLRA